jgi:hypothetical protein
MLYSFTHVSTVTGCDQLITQAQRESEIVTRTRNNILNSVNSQQTGRAIAQDDLDATNAEIAILEPIVAGLPVDSTERLDKEQDLFDLMSKRSGLLKTLKGGIGDKQYSLGKYEYLLAWLVEFIAAVEARKLELQNA